MDLEVRSADESELYHVLSVMDEAAAWLHASGITEQWPASFSDRPEWVDSFRGLITRRAVFLAWRRDQAIASLVLRSIP